MCHSYLWVLFLSFFQLHTFNSFICFCLYSLHSSLHFFLLSFRYLLLPFCFSVEYGWRISCDLYVLAGCTVCHLSKCTQPDSQSVIMPCYFSTSPSCSTLWRQCTLFCLYVRSPVVTFLLYSRQLLWRRLKFFYSFYFLIFVTNDLRISLIELSKYFT